MAAPWFIVRGDQKFGPYSIEQLRQFAGSGQLLADELIQHEGSLAPILANSLTGLFSTDAFTAHAATPVLPRTRGYDRDDESADGEKASPALWNPTVAANLSLLFTPAFGSYLHAANWRTLGVPAKAIANLVWMWITIVFLAINLGLLFVGESKVTEAVTRFGGLGLLVAWFVSQGKTQVHFIEENFPEGYTKKSIWPPVGIAIGVALAYLATAFVVVFFLYTPSPDEIAAEIKPLILNEWKKNPNLRDAAIRKITLVHAEGATYRGTVDAILGGRPERLELKVVIDQGDIAWELKPMQ